MNERLDYVERHQNIDEQLIEAERKIDVHLGSLDELSQELVLGVMLPEHLRAKLLTALLLLRKLKLLRLFELIARQRRKRKEKKKRIQEQMRDVRRRLDEIEQKKEQVRAVKQLYAQIYSFCYARTTLSYYHRTVTIPEFITRKEHNVLFKAKAESYRAAVPPENRPALKIKVANHRPIDNGGKAVPPPMIKNRFNERSRSEKYKAMNESLIWLEKRNPERTDSNVDIVKKEFLETSLDLFASLEMEDSNLIDYSEGKTEPSQPL
jgi:hypothetical protein